MYNDIFRSSSFDPFLDLSVPIYRGENTEPSTKIQSSSMLSALKSTVINSISDNNKISTLEKCLGKFTGNLVSFILIYISIYECIYPG